MAYRTSPSFYDVLGLDKSATVDDIRRAYRKRALETHPDKLSPGSTDEGKQIAEKEFHKVHEAFEVLGDPQKRRTYDARLAMKLDPQTLSDEAARRMADRMQWATRQREQHEKRMEKMRKEAEQERLARKQLVERLEKETVFINEILQELHEMNPEIAARKKAALEQRSKRTQPAQRTPPHNASTRPI